MKKYGIILFILVGLVMAIALTGCGQESTVARKDVLYYALDQEPATLDPAKSTTLAESTTELAIFEGLTRLNKKDLPEPAAAEKWTVSSDGLTYTFTLRKGLRWADGAPLTAHDFEYAWKRALDPNLGSGNAYMMFTLKNGEAYYEGKAKAEDIGVKATDDRTLVVQLEYPAAYFLGLTAFHSYYPVPRHIVEKNPDTWAAEAKTIVGNGPFVMTKWQHSGEMRFVKNDKYWDADAVKTKDMVWPISESQTTRLTLAEGGEVDLMLEPPMADQKRLLQSGKLKILPSLGISYYVFNVTAPPFDNVKVRQAFALAINRQLIVDNVMQGSKLVADAFVPPGMTDSVTGRDFREEGGSLTGYDAAKARTLLAESGYGKDKPLPPITILYNTNETSKAISETMQEMWKQELGVTAELQNQETKVFMQNRSNGNYQVARASWIGDFADPENFLTVFTDATNDARFHDPYYDSLVKRAQMTTNQTERTALFHKAEAYLFDQAVVIPIYYTTVPYMVSPYLRDYIVSSLGIIDFKRAYKE